MDYLDISLLRTCVTVVDEGGFNEAAKALRISQPAVSQQISRLESSLGREVFVSIGHRRQPSLTGFGVELVNESRALLKAHRQACQRLAHRKKLVTIGVTPMSADFTTQKVLEKISALLGSDTHIRITEYSSTLRELVLSGDIDLAFVLNFDSQDTDSDVGQIEYRWFSSPSREFISIEDQPHVITFGDERCRVTKLGLETLKAFGLHPKVVFHASSVEVACTSARAGTGMVLLNSTYPKGGLMMLNGIPTIDPVQIKMIARDGFVLNFQRWRSALNNH